MDWSISLKHEIWFLRVCHHISNAVYLKLVPTARGFHIPEVGNHLLIKPSRTIPPPPVITIIYTFLYTRSVDHHTNVQGRICCTKAHVYAHVHLQLLTARSRVLLGTLRFLSKSASIVPTGTLRLPWLRCSRAFSSVARQMPGYNSQRRSTARTLPN